MSLHLIRPEWLWALLPAVILAVLLWRHRRRRGSWSGVIAPELLPFLVGPGDDSRAANLLPLIFLGWVLAALAASGPSWEKLPQPVHQKQDALVVLLDLSYSMKSEDLAPSRLDRARQKILDLLAARREGQTGLIAYAGDAHIVTPLTDDTQTIANLLPALNPDMMPMPGSEPGAAVAQAAELLHSAGIRGGRILLITDGVDERDRKEIRNALAGTGAELAIMGVGTRTGAPIPLPQGGFLKDGNGTIVMPTLDEQALRELASATGGRYSTMRIDNDDLDRILTRAPITGAQSTVALDRTADTWEDQGYLFILPLLPLALALFRRGWILCLLPLLFVAQPRVAEAAAWDDLWLTPDQQGQRALQQAEHDTAAQLFEDPAWAGTAAYQGEDYEAAAEAFSQRDDADAWYNRGNALARAGQLDEAIAAYQESLARLPDQEDAQANLALLEQLKEQQEQQQNQEQQDQEQDQKQDQQQQQEQNQEQEQNQQQNQDQQQDQQQQQQNQEQAQQEQQNQENQEQREREQQQQEQEQAEKQAQEQEREQQQEAEQAESREEQQVEPPAEIDPEQQERDQAMEQWLRRVPDDPSGLLKEKFRYESYKRQQEGARRNDEQVW
jgi:Ca-activated chloride channel family protein